MKLSNIKSKRVLFVHNYLARFIKIDRDLLTTRYSTTEYYMKSWRKIKPMDVLHQVSTHDLVFCWFASWHSVLPILYARLLGKPSVLVIGGYDIANLAQIGYGHQRGGVERWISRLTIYLAKCIITNSYYSQQEAIRNIRLTIDRVHVIYHGVIDVYGVLPMGKRERIALTIGNICKENIKRKGHELFVKTAHYLPDVKFIIVGKWQDNAIDYLRQIAPENVEFTGWLEDEPLNDLISKSSVYLQLSQHEGFGLSMAESMLAGCIPVVTRAGSIPEVVGKAGTYVSADDPVEIAEVVAELIESDDSRRSMVRQRILANFPIEKRRKALCELIERVMGN